jgi:hypothetical protein
MSKLRTEIKILNPPPGTRSLTSESRARRYVKQGRASWQDAARLSIRFVEHDPRHQAIVVVVDKTAPGYLAASQKRASHLDTLLDQMLHVPIQRREMALGMGRSKHR